MPSTLKRYLVTDRHMNQGNAAHSASCPETQLHRFSQVVDRALGSEECIGVHLTGEWGRVLLVAKQSQAELELGQGG